MSDLKIILGKVTEKIKGGKKRAHLNEMGSFG